MSSSIFDVLIHNFRYGSVLGATFASMFPVRFLLSLLVALLTYFFFLQDKIERLVIDGVVDSENYYASK